MSKYAKALAAILGAVGTWGTTAAADGQITSQEYFGLLLAISTALVVYVLPNKNDPNG
jgi:hypothetical protein